MIHHSNHKPRVLPEIVLAGIRFTIDGRLNEFRETAAPWNSFSMDEIIEKDGLLGILIDKKTHNAYRETVDSDHLPSHVEFVYLPPVLELDPVGIARRHGLPDDEFTKSIREARQPHADEAKVTPGRYL